MQFAGSAALARQQWAFKIHPRLTDGEMAQFRVVQHGLGVGAVVERQQLAGDGEGFAMDRIESAAEGHGCRGTRLGLAEQVDGLRIGHGGVDGAGLVVAQGDALAAVPAIVAELLS